MLDGKEIEVVIADFEVLFMFFGFLDQRIAFAGPINEEAGT